MNNAETLEIVEIFKGYMENKDIDDNTVLKEDIKNLGISSLNFVQIVVKIELKFGFEFADEDLKISRFQKVKDIISYVNDKVYQNS